MDGLWWKTLLKWMSWGYHYFWKHPTLIIYLNPVLGHLLIYRWRDLSKMAFQKKMPWLFFWDVWKPRWKQLKKSGSIWDWYIWYQPVPILKVPHSEIWPPCVLSGKPKTQSLPCFVFFSYLANILQMGWSHQLDAFCQFLMLQWGPSAVVVLGCGLNGYLNTEPNTVFGALGNMFEDHVLR